MASDVNLYQWVRGILRATMGQDNEGKSHVTTGGEAIVAQGLPPETELARQGIGFYTAPTISGLAASAGYPTTAAMLSLYNGNSTKSLVIAAAGALCYTGANAIGNYSLIIRNDVPGANTAATGGNIIQGMDGRMYSGQAVSKSLVTLAAIGAANNTAWIPAGNTTVVTPSASTGSFYGTNLYTECYGRWIVRPGGMFSIAVVGQPTTVSFTGYAKFYELTLPLP